MWKRGEYRVKTQGHVTVTLMPLCNGCGQGLTNVICLFMDFSFIKQDLKT
jgi:hypothetical protein